MKTYSTLKSLITVELSLLFLQHLCYFETPPAGQTVFLTSLHDTLDSAAKIRLSAFLNLQMIDSFTFLVHFCIFQWTNIPFSFRYRQ